MSTPYVGEIRIFGGNFAPVGWAFCAGQVVPISENETLYNLIGTTYGGDGTTTFALPNLQGRLPVHQGTGAGATYLIGDAAGTEEVTLLTTDIPAHTHPLLANGTTGVADSPAGHVLAASPTLDLYRESNPSTPLALTTVSQVGGSLPHSNLQPALCVNFIISLFGIYPTQS